MVSIRGHARPVALALLLRLANTSAFLMPPSPPSPSDTRVSSVFSSGIEAGKPGADLTSLLKEPSWPFDKTTFFCPFEAAGVSPLAPRRSTLKPVLLYLPGLDGSGLTPFVQYPDLANVFELRCLTIPATDRSTFTDLISLVRQQLQMCKGRQVFIMGESFGGLLALGTALDALKKSAPYTQNIKGVVLVNPATSFSRTLWAKMGTYLTRLPKPLYTLSMLPIGILLIDAGQIRFTLAELAKQLLSNLQIISNRISQPDLSPFHASFYRAALPVLIQKLDLLPQNTLDWRLLQWLSAGSDMVEPQLHRISYPVLVVAGTVDRLLPSYEEAKRLQAELSSKCSVHYARDMGHGGTLDQRTNLTAILTAWPPCAEVLSPQKLKATRVRLGKGTKGELRQSVTEILPSAYVRIPAYLPFEASQYLMTESCVREGASIASWRAHCSDFSKRREPCAQGGMSSYGTFGTTITRSLWPRRHYDTRSTACSYSVFKALAPSLSPCSPRPDLPVVYRCSLLADGNGLQGVRLGPSSCEREVVVKEVFSETISEICRIRPGDIVTHANNAEVKGSWQVVQDACNSCHGVVELRLMRGKSGLCELDEYGRLVSGGSKLLRRSPVFFYEVHSCDTLQHIAAAFDTTQEVIRKDNRGVFEAGVKANLEAGQLLKIRNAHVVESGGNDEDSRPISSSSHEDPSMLKRRYHEVRDGETVDQVAQQHGISVSDVRKYNRCFFPVGESGTCIPGMRLVVYEKVEGKASAS